MTVPDYTTLPGIEDFLKTARYGTRPTASTGEASAARLAKEIKDLSWLMMDMDRNLQEGFISALLVAANPDSRSTLLRILGQS